MWVEILGYAASAIIVLAISMTSLFRLRVLGVVGAVTFGVYGALIGSIPVVITNVVIASVHGFFLFKILRRHELFSVLLVAPDSAYLQYFCEFHAADIQRFQPGWTLRPTDGQISSFVLRDLVPAGLVIMHPQEDGTLEVGLDYVIPQYRDFKVGPYLFSRHSGVFDDLPHRVAWSLPWSESHAAYLRRIGFRRATRPDGTAVLEIDLGRIRPA